MSKLEWNEELVTLPDGTEKIKAWKIYQCKNCGKEFSLKGVDQSNIDDLDMLTMRHGNFCDVECLVQFGSKGKK